jgi:hypothetical protein
MSSISRLPWTVGLLASKPVKKVVKSEPEPDKKAVEKGEKPSVPAEPKPPVPAEPKPPVPTEPKPEGEKSEESPDPVPGAFQRASVYDDHFVTFGSPEEVFPLINTDLILAPLKPTDGRNLVNFAARDVLVSGFCWPGTLELMAGKPLVLYQSLSKGHIVAFSDDPNYRAMTPTSQRFFLNAVFLGPGH